MTQHVYLAKANDELVSHCRCASAEITFPPQLDCPWCGCGWLFTCIRCRKAFTFAVGVLVDEPWEAIARRDLTNLRGQAPSGEDIAAWVVAMKELLKTVEPAKLYVAFDGRVFPTDANGMAFSGWHSAHRLDSVPQVAALHDPSVLKNLLANPTYWLSTKLEEDGE